MGASDDGVRPDPRGAAYPEAWEADVVLRDGSTTHIRPIRPEDADALQAFHVAQSEQSIFLRFFAPLERLPERDLARFTRVDHRDRVALVAVTQDDAIIGVARYDRVGPDEAEVAFNIADAHHGRGLGSVLLEHLAAAARERGIRRFVAEVLPQNGRMIAVFREAGYTLRQQLEDGVVQVAFDIDPTERSMAVMLGRERSAEARSVQGLLTARRLLLVAAPDADPQSLDARRAGRVLSALLAGERRPPIGARTGAVQAPILGEPVDLHVVGAVPGGDDPAVRRWARLEDVPSEVDLAVLALPAAQTVLAVRALGRIGVRAVVVLSGGYAEEGEAGLALHRALLRTAHAAGMRVIGPVSYGLISHTPAGLVNASLAEEPPPPGRIGLFCQSAANAVSILASVRRRGLGLAHLVSAGNRADVSGNDLMQFWQEDESTDVVGLYLESIGNPRKFARVARRLARRKPVVVVTAGSTGHVVPPGHAVRTTMASRRTLEEVVQRSGVTLVENTHQMLEAAQLFALQPLPAGRRAAVLASSGSLAALVAEAAVSHGLTADAAPVIVPEEAEQELIDRAVATVYDDPAVDVVIAVHVPTVGPRDDRVAAAMARAAAHSGKTSVACLPGLHGATEALTAPGPDQVLRTIPAYTTPEDAVLALGQAARYAAWRSAERGTVVHPEPMHTRTARRLVQQWIAEAGRPDRLDLDRDQIGELLACAGVSLVPSVPVCTADEAVAAAERMGWPVALKTTVPTLRHRADLGGVRLDVHDAAELRADVRQVLELAAGHEGAPGRAPLEVQPMAPHGVACVIRTAEDPLYGPVIGFGLAGDTTDLLGDYAFAVPPLTDVDVADVVRAPRSAPRLFGYRGLPLLDVAAVEDVLARVGVLADDLPELLSVELNPVVVAEHGAYVLGAAVTVGPAAARTDGVRRALTT
ncbi:GNAT family N-acetyltransferase [Cellulomonas denverensis]|uniref:GNAT family N-acetyltransferase n=2 Tax=Cellulomonas denverensis TaxID=264297 RepID=A0A7X6QZK5_9CELL|nr:GNAT family N-acetyltransferase [Cellulomonas denverensis]NKY23303.1 GNAT family N-acetyltransferase [Cellulomonas denverensis]GIG24409.1 GNAT family N-acetyltransferase [Cellulomonas denverensis]